MNKEDACHLQGMSGNRLSEKERIPCRKGGKKRCPGRKFERWRNFSKMANENQSGGGIGMITAVL